MKSWFLKRKSLIVVLLLFFLITSFYAGIVDVCVSKQNGITIVLDAGHGGLDVK